MSRLGSRTATLLLAALAACGPSGSGAPGPPPLPSAAPTPSAGPGPTPTAVAPQAFPALDLDTRGRATSVNHRQWISVVSEVQASVIGLHGILVLPPDAAPEVAPPPQLPCEAAPPEVCFHQFDVPLQVTESDWVYGYRVVFGSGGPFIPLPAAFGPDDAFSLLLDVARPPLPLDDVRGIEARICPGPRFLGDVLVVAGEGTAHVPLLWPGPSPEALRLPAAGDGAVPMGCDVAGRIAGVDEPHASVWLPSAAGYTQVLLPGSAELPSAALGIDDGQVVGRAANRLGDRAMVWIGDELSPRMLPDLAADLCRRAVAVSGARIAGQCGTVAVVWRRQADAQSWRIEAALEPLPGDDLAEVLAISGDLAVGWSGTAEEPRAVAWRLP